MSKVIIDGIDVERCQYYNDKNGKCRTFSYEDGIKFTSYKCKDDKRCYFKQAEKLYQAVLNKNKIIEKLTDENERLKECVNKIKEMLQNEHPFKDCSCGQDILDKISEVLNE